MVLDPLGLKSVWRYRWGRLYYGFDLAGDFVADDLSQVNSAFNTSTFKWSRERRES